MTRSKCFMILLLCCCALLTLGQSNPETWFDTQYTDALEQCHVQEEAIDSVMRIYEMPVRLSMSVVMPEMIRYSLWKDWFETKALELLYVKGGSQAADFSIGWMQMKPSFAEQLEQCLRNDTLLLDKYYVLIAYSATDTVDLRAERVNRLRSFDWQLKYLCAFVDVQRRTLHLNRYHTNKQLTLLTASYNRGLGISAEALLSFAHTKTFPYGPRRENPFSYSEVASYFYYKHSKTLFND